MLATIKKVSVMGCGWLGFPLAVQLIDAGYEVLGSTTTEEKIPTMAEAGITPFLIRVEDQVEGAIEDLLHSDLLILNIPPGRRRKDVSERYPQEIRMVVEKAMQAGIRRLIFISSTSVYADANGVVTEDRKSLATSGSGLALVRSEAYLRGIPDLYSTVLRLGGLVGGDRKPGRFLAGKKGLTNGAAPVNMVHREDCIAVIMEIIKQEIFGPTFNVCADEHPSRESFYRTQAVKDGFEAPTFLPGKVSAYKVVDNSKVKARLGYTFIHPDPMEF